MSRDNAGDRVPSLSMWATVLVLALWMATDPARVAIAALLISRPRPLLNLGAYWLGGITSGVGTGVVILLLLREFVPTILQDLSSTVAIFTSGYVRITLGVLALVFAALISVGFLMRQHARVAVGGAAPSALAEQPSTPTALTRITARAQRVWQTGHPGVAFVAGLGSALPPVEYMVALTTILASGAALGEQLGAAVMFTVVVLVMIEMPLISYLATPAKTQALVLQLQNWMRAHSRRLLAIMAAVAGIFLVTTGMGSV
jgi:Sap-like sulfolipid-1-addressing protein